MAAQLLFIGTTEIMLIAGIALLLFGGIPLPGTGAWSGTLAASILDLDFKKSCIYVMLGVLLAGCIMLAASYGVFGAVSLAA